MHQQLNYEFECPLTSSNIPLTIPWHMLDHDWLIAYDLTTVASNVDAHIRWSYGRHCRAITCEKFRR